MNRRDFLRLGAGVGTLSLLQAPGPGGRLAPAQALAAPAAAAEPKRGGTFTMATTENIQRFNPYRIINPNLGYRHAVFNTLVRLDKNLNPQPELAERWQFSSDGRTLTLELRQGVRFHSGREFTSEDVKASVEFGSTDPQSTQRPMYQAIKKVETPGKYTAVFQFDIINPSVFDTLDLLFVIDKETIQHGETAVNGTGPFKLDKFIPNDRAEFVRFKDYWEQGKPYLDRYVQRAIPDYASLAINLEAGAVDCIWRANLVDIARLQREGGKITTDMGMVAVFYDLAVNCTVEPFTDKRVRQALAWSIDRARFCRATLRGLADPTCLMWPRTSWAYFKEYEGKIGFDLDKAKALLKEAGLEKGFETEIMTSSKRSFGFGDFAQILQADLKKIGINAKVDDVDPAVYNTRILKADMKLMVHDYGRANRDPGTMVTAAKAWFTEKEGAWTRFVSDEYDQLRKDLQSTLDREKRIPVARKIQEFALDQCFTIVVAPQLQPFALASHVKGFDYDVDNALVPTEIWLER